MEEGRGSIDMRFGAVEERRSGAGRAAAGCDDMVRVVRGRIGRGCRGMGCGRRVGRVRRLGGLTPGHVGSTPSVHASMEGYHLNCLAALTCT
jgi:hypothetical protein